MVNVAEVQPVLFFLQYYGNDKRTAALGETEGPSNPVSCLCGRWQKLSKREKRQGVDRVIFSVYIFPASSGMQFR